MKRRTADENRQRMAVRRAHWKAHGLCFRCQLRLDGASVQFCVACLLAAREYRRSYGGHQPRRQEQPR